jgi:tetratricopeptide (TPR) repeat protein
MLRSIVQRIIIGALLYPAVTSASKADKNIVQLSKLIKQYHQRELLSPKQVIKLFLPLRETAIKAGNERFFHYAAILAWAYNQSDQLDLSNQLHHAAEVHANESIKQSRHYRWHLGNWTFNYIKQGKFEAARQMLSRMYREIELHEQDKQNLIFAMLLDLWLCVNDGKFEKAVDLGYQALKLNKDPDTWFASENDRGKQLSKTLSSLANLYHEFDPGRAINMRLEALELSRKYKHISSIEGNIHHLARLYLDINDLGKAGHMIEDLIEFSSAHHRPLGFLSAYTSESRLFLMLGDTDNAEKALLRAKVHLTSDAPASLRERFVLQQARIFEALNEPGAVVSELEGHRHLFAEESSTNQRRLKFLALLASSYAAIEQHDKAMAVQAESLLIVKKLTAQENQLSRYHSERIMPL